MSEKIAAALVVLFGTIQIGLTLKCYTCVGSHTSDCSKADVSSMLAMSCEYHQPSITKSSLFYDAGSYHPRQEVCVTVSQLDYKQPLLLRRCLLVPNNIDSDICTFLESTGHFEKCSACSTDLCNKDPVIGESEENTIPS